MIDNNRAENAIRPFAVGRKIFAVQFLNAVQILTMEQLSELMNRVR